MHDLIWSLHKLSWENISLILMSNLKYKSMSHLPKFTQQLSGRTRNSIQVFWFQILYAIMICVKNETQAKALLKQE